MHNIRILNRVKEYHGRAKDKTVVDLSWKFAKTLLFAKRKKKAISIEELAGLIEEINEEDKKNR